ncbi:MAG: HupE/UreJ family protein [Bacteroidota bacterium]
MNSFIFYFQIGWEHIISPDALDHQLFITALMASYLWDQWRQVLILVTAFTLGHSLTLALSAFDWIRMDENWVEFLIPLTIVLTCLMNIYNWGSSGNRRRAQYVLAAAFGLIHGMGFANNIRFMLAKDENFALNLLAFNVGLEVGQLAIVALLLALGYLIVIKGKMARNHWSIFLTTASFSVALWITIQRIQSL